MLLLGVFLPRLANVRSSVQCSCSSVAVHVGGSSNRLVRTNSASASLGSNNLNTRSDAPDALRNSAYADATFPAANPVIIE